MKRLFLDTNVIVDVLGRREGFWRPAVELFDLVQQTGARAYMSSLTVATTSYLLRAQFGHAEVRRKLRLLRVAVEVASIDGSAVDQSLANEGFSDFEDGLQYYAAIAAGCECIITRDRKGFASGQLPVYTPQEFLLTHR